MTPKAAEGLAFALTGVQKYDRFGPSHRPTITTAVRNP
jgi:hypothetical protein